MTLLPLASDSILSRRLFKDQTTKRWVKEWTYADGVRTYDGTWRATPNDPRGKVVPNVPASF